MTEPHDLSPQPWPTDLVPDAGGFVHVPPGVYQHPTNPNAVVTLPLGGVYGSGGYIDISDYTGDEPGERMLLDVTGRASLPYAVHLPVVGQGATLAEAHADVAAIVRRVAGEDALFSYAGPAHASVELNVEVIGQPPKVELSVLVVIEGALPEGSFRLQWIDEGEPWKWGR